MIQICDKCFKIYRITSFIKTNNECDLAIDSFLKCSVIKCNGNLFEIDELFAPVIAILNKKGYKTLKCCSGHIKGDTIIVYNRVYQKKDKNYCIDSYIQFDESIKLPNFPEGYLIEEDNTIRREFNFNKRTHTLIKEIMNNTSSVLDWCMKLPSLRK